MKKYLLGTFIIGAAILFSTGCSKDNGTGGYDPGFGDPTDVNIVLRSPATRALTGGKEDGSTEENHIEVLELYVYSADGLTPDDKVGTGNGYVKLSGSDLTMTPRIRVSTGTDLNFLVVANSNLGAPASGETLADIMAKPTKKSFPQLAGTGKTPRDIPADGFEMSGLNTATITQGSSNNVYITLYRTVGKVNPPTLAANIPVQFDQQEQLDELFGAGSGVVPTTDITFNYMGYTVVNGYDVSDISFIGNTTRDYKDPVQFPWNLWSSTGKDRIGSEFDNNNEYYTFNYSGQSAVNSGSWFLAPTEGPVYVYESKPIPITNKPGISGYEAPSVISYIIEGELVPDPATSVAAVTRYWRVDLTKDENYHIMRNVVYKVAINKITTPGYGTPGEAEDPDRPVPGDDTTADFVISIAQWDINQYATEM